MRFGSLLTSKDEENFTFWSLIIVKTIFNHLKVSMRPSSFTVGNFKAISKPQKLLLRPITLLFGQNSAGKSSIIQSLLLCQHALRKGTFDFASVKRWGQNIDLGGFRQYIHKHEVDRNLTFGFSFERTETELEMNPQEAKISREVIGDEADWSFHYLNSLFELEVVFTVGFPKSSGDLKSVPRVLDIEIVVDGVSLIDFNYDNRRLEFSRLNELNPPLVLGLAGVLSDYAGYKQKSEALKTDEVLSSLADERPDIDSDFLKPIIEQTKAVHQAIIDEAFAEDSDSDKEENGLQSHLLVLENHDLFARCALQIYEALQQELNEPRRLLQIDGDGLKLKLNSLRRGPSVRHDVRSPYDGGEFADTGTALGRAVEVEAIEDPVAFFLEMPDKDEIGVFDALAKAMRFDLEQLVEASLGSVAHWLDSTEYIGPYRSIPERFFQISKDSNSEEVDQGYQLLRKIAEDPKLINQMTEIFQDVLKSPYRLEARTIAPSLDLMQLEEELKRAQEREGANQEIDFIRKTIRDLSEGRTRKGVYLVDTRNNAVVDFCDVGFGISQVLPLVAELLQIGDGLICIEQPEVHLHPKMQTDLADVVINSMLSKKDWKRLVMESHSEHIILRLLRRVRESTQSGALDGIRPDDLAVSFINNSEGNVQIVPLPVTEEGDFSQDWPLGFFTERMEEYD
ncbi:MAG: AAA family ATPase [Flavobacteriaceae bacterium]